MVPLILWPEAIWASLQLNWWLSHVVVQLLFPLIQNVCVCVSIISWEKKPAAFLWTSRASGFPPGREAGIEKLKEMKCPRVYISPSPCDLTRIHRHGVNTREMDLYVWTRRVNAAALHPSGLMSSVRPGRGGSDVKTDGLKPAGRKQRWCLLGSGEDR